MSDSSTLSAKERNELVQFFAALDAEIDAHQPRCDASGRCCRFSEYGHTLFLSAVEAELLFEAPPISKDGGECPYQIGGRCTARERRPVGCRTYFCDPGFAEQMPVISEQAIRRLKDLHDSWGRPWDYRPLDRFLRRPTPDSAPTNATIPSLPILSSTPRRLDSSRCGK